MKNTEELIRAMSRGLAPTFLYFWGHTADAPVVGKACLSQWFPAEFTVDGRVYPSAEHFMMEQKALLFNDPDTAEAARTAATCAEAKALGRRVRNFDDAVWMRERMLIVVRGNLAKFSQHPALADFLLSTGQQVLVEASPVDQVWGIGLTEGAARKVGPQGWRGLNLLGYALMEVRDAIRTGSGVSSQLV